MANRITTMTHYKTIPYRQKVEEEQEAAICRLLEYLPPYVEDYSKHKKSRITVKTRREYIQDLLSFFSFLCDAHPECMGMTVREIPLRVLNNLTLDDFSAYNNWLTDKDTGCGSNATVTIKRKISSLRSFFSYLYASEKITVNTVAKIEPIKAETKDRSRIRVLTDKEREVFLAEFDKEYEKAVEKLNEALVCAEKKGKPVSEAVRMKPALVKRDKAIIYLFLGTGLRNSELCAINCGHFAPALNQINVIRKGEAKNKEYDPTDHVLLGDDVMAVLTEYLNEYRDIIGPDINNYDAMFLSSKHTRITPRAIEQMVKIYTDRTLGENSGVHPHVLRASFGFRYQQKYGNILATSEVMNHSSPAVTAQYYLTSTEKSKEDAQKVTVT